MTDIYEPETLTRDESDTETAKPAEAAETGAGNGRGWRLPVRLTKTPVDLTKPEHEGEGDAVGEALEGVVVYHPTATRSTADPDSDGVAEPLAGGGAGLPEFVKTDRRDRERLDLIPAWVKNPEALKATAKWAWEYYSHCVAFHALRLPVYWGRLAARAHVGVARIVKATTLWMLDYEHHMIRSALVVKAADPHSFLRLREEHRNVVKFRAAIVAAAMLPVLVAMVLVATAPAVTRLAAMAIVLAALGWVGRKGNTRLTGRAVDSAEVPRLTAELIVKALAALGLPQINAALKADGVEAIGFTAITRDGPGFRADLDLPGGVTAGEVINKRGKLASGLRRPLGCVWPEADPDIHEGRLLLYVADKSLSEAKPVPWPLAKSGKANIFEPVTIGVDQRGRPVTVTLMYASGLIGAVPRMGKTFCMRLLFLAAALDVRVELHAYNLKGGADLNPLAHVAHSYRSGDKEEHIEHLVADLRALQKEMRRRYDVLETLPLDQCPESKVTDELASVRSLGLHPIFFGADECQVMFEHATHGPEIIELVTDLVKRGPAVAIMVWVATQRPDAKSIPTGISANAVLRLCLKVQGQTENDMVLGTSMYKAGIRATMFSRKDRGIAYLAGEGDDPIIVRTSYVDAPAADAIAARARAARVAANRLTGQAAGLDDLPEPDEATDTILDHLIGCWPATTDGTPERKVWCHTLAGRLAEHWPALYHGWEAKQVTAAVAPYGLRTTQVKRTIDGRSVNNNGLDHAAVHKALTQPETRRQPRQNGGAN